jgi:hypothetical protein
LPCCQTFAVCQEPRNTAITSFAVYHGERTRQRFKTRQHHKKEHGKKTTTAKVRKRTRQRVEHGELQPGHTAKVDGTAKTVPRVRRELSGRRRHNGVPLPCVPNGHTAKIHLPRTPLPSRQLFPRVVERRQYFGVKPSPCSKEEGTRQRGLCRVPKQKEHGKGQFPSSSPPFLSSFPPFLSRHFSTRPPYIYPCVFFVCSQLSEPRPAVLVVRHFMWVPFWAEMYRNKVGNMRDVAGRRFM